jgi:phosphoadenosine phosphosulfate reductase
MNTTQKIPTVPQIEEHTSPEEIYRIGAEIADGPISLASSFSIEDVVLIDLLRDHHDHITIFAIDTGRLNEETYEVAEGVTQKYGIRINWYFPQQAAVEKLEGEKGLFSFRDSLENRKECCSVRKVEPLRRAINGQSGWITGMRRDQSMTRTSQEPLEIDVVNGGLLKINPLTYWTAQEVWTYAEQNRLPINRLHQQGYPSIGCAPCTRAVQPGEHPRAGRWWWENPEHRECGLHSR